MDLDEEELKATREMKAINKIIANANDTNVGNIKNADEMFENLGYKKDIEVSYGLIRYNKDDNAFIR